MAQIVFITKEKVAMSAYKEYAYLLDNRKPKQTVLFAKDGKDIIGAVKLKLESGETGREVIGNNIVISDIVVGEASRGKGYGKAILKELENWLKNQRFLPRTISLAVELDNKPALALYRSLHYQSLLEDGKPRLIPSTTPGKTCYIMYKTV